MSGSTLANVLEHLSLSGTYHIHHIGIVAPLLALLQHLLKESFAVFVLSHLEIQRALVGCKSQEDYPLVLISQEGLHAVLTHIRGDSQGIKVVLLKECTGIHSRCVADIPSLGIGDDEVMGIMLVQIVNGLFKGHDSLHAEGFIESQIGLVGHTVVCRGIYDGLVEGEDRVFLIQQMGRNFLQVGIQSYAEERLLVKYLFYQFLSVHNVNAICFRVHFPSDAQRFQPR